MSQNSNIKDAEPILGWVWYTGTDALAMGEALCYLAAGENKVTRPTALNNRRFAGVVARNESASSTGQFVEIHKPGSLRVPVAVGGAAVSAGDMLTMTVGSGSEAGRFIRGGFAGAGSVRIMASVAAKGISVLTGTWSLAVDGITLTVASQTAIAAGDTVVLLGGADEGDDKAVVPGKYTVASVTSATVLVLATSAVGATPSNALKVTGYAYTGNPVAYADLLTGDESGGVEFVSVPIVGDADGDQLDIMDGGVSCICGGVTIGTEAANGALADGDFLGQLKGLYCLGTLTTNDAQVTLATAGVQNAVTVAETVGTPTALAAATFDAAGEQLFMQWFGVWKEMAHTGCAISAT